VREGVYQDTKFHKSVEDLVVIHVSLVLKRVRGVLRETLRSPRRMTRRFLRWREATKSISSSHSARAAEEVVRPNGVQMSKACQRLC
jgi:hypothetical protein